MADRKQVTKQQSEKNIDNNKKPSNNNKYQGESTKVNKLELFPVLFVVAVIPLIMRLKAYISPLFQYPWFSTNNQYSDLFLYYKQIFIILISVIMVIVIATKAYMDKRSIDFKTIFIPLAVYAVLALLSSIVSKYRSLSFTGSFEQFESIFVILGYCVIAYYSFLLVKTESDIRYIIKGLLIAYSF